MPIDKGKPPTGRGNGAIGKPGVVSNEAPGFAVSEATAGSVHTPCLVMLDQPVKRLLRCQALVNVVGGDTSRGGLFGSSAASGRSGYLQGGSAGRTTN
jgi:hypothetical protein